MANNVVRQKYSFKKALRYLRNGSKFLAFNKDFNFQDKFKTVRRNPTVRDLNLHNMILKKIIVRENGERYFLLDGFKIFFQPDYNIINDDFFLKAITQILAETYLFPVFFNSKIRLAEGSVVFDIGACIGTTALMFSRIVGDRGKVFAFEPVTYNIINKNIIQNSVKNIEVVSKGVCDKSGITEIEKSDFCIDSSICKREYTAGYYMAKDLIEVITLDEFCSERSLSRLDFIKLDIEGAEEFAIKGAEKIIAKYHPKWSISSYHIDSENELQHNKLIKLLKGFGYKIEHENGFHIYAW